MNSFHTVVFKEGLNLIVGQQANPDDDNKKNTYNGVGKSLVIYLIHFCLGSNAMKVFEEKIPGWEFKLEFEINEENYNTTRNTSKQNEIYLNGSKHTLSSFRKEMLSKVFDVNKNYKNLTFNSLFSRFIRRDRECYTQFDKFISKEQDYAKLINNSFLLGIDIDLIARKKELRESYKAISELTKGLEKDPVIKEYFNNQEDAEIDILDLESEIISLERDLSEFKVAKNYHDIEKEADDYKFLLKEVENKRVNIQSAIRNIEKSLKIQPDVSFEKVMQLYKQAKVEIPKMVVKEVEEVIDFHKNLLINRKSRLNKEIKKNKDILHECEDQINDYNKKLDERLKYLDTHRALDEYVALNNKLSDLKIKRNKLGEYQEILKTYRKKLRDIQFDYAKQTEEAENFLDDNKELFETVMNTFRELSKQFYDKPGGIKIENNEGENTLRFNINAKIQDDSSDGVNEVKIFCFDMTLLLLQLNHRVKFLFHDSRLYSNMDPRQRFTLFKVAHEKANLNKLQYIASINEDTLDSFKDFMNNKDYKNIIEDNIILKLTDESESSKLLGIQIDMDYDK